MLISVTQWLFAQEDSIRSLYDSTRIRPENSFLLSSPSGLIPGKLTIYPTYSVGRKLIDLPDFSLKNEYRLPYYTDRTPLFQGDYSTGGVIRQMPQGAFIGSGEQTTVPGIGRFNTASFGYQHVFSRKLMVKLHANAMKINMDRLVAQTFGVSGDMVYRPVERVAFKVFGSYDVGNSYGMSTHRYGATVSFDMSERFGMEVGAQRYYNALRGNWETVPVAIPYYRFDKFTLGFDVGGVVYEILRNVVFDKKRYDNPTMAPPRFVMPRR